LFFHIGSGDGGRVAGRRARLVTSGRGDARRGRGGGCLRRVHGGGGAAGERRAAPADGPPDGERYPGPPLGAGPGDPADADRLLRERQAKILRDKYDTTSARPKDEKTAGRMDKALDYAEKAVDTVETFQDSSHATTAGKALEAGGDLAIDYAVHKNPVLGKIDDFLPEEVKLSGLYEAGMNSGIAIGEALWDPAHASEILSKQVEENKNSPNVIVRTAANLPDDVKNVRHRRGEARAEKEHPWSACLRPTFLIWNCRRI
jgi:hypothetical protein